MIWDCQQSIVNNDPIVLPCNFNSKLLGIEIAVSNLRDTWYRSGYLTTLIDLEGEVFSGKKYELGFGFQLIEIPYRSYRLQFDPNQWLLNTTIRIKQLSTTQIEQITTMYVSPVSNPLPEIGEPIYTTVTPAQANEAVPVFTIVPPRSRRSVLITNKTNKAVYLKEGAAASIPTLVAGNPFVAIAAGNSYTIEDWSGEIVGLMAANYAASGKIIVKELPYLAE